uniref:THD domain-containing protein n=1 Tax=Sphaeramia orbicularis TaxID=375764 RepID=A0A673CBB7_9TELE
HPLESLEDIQAASLNMLHNALLSLTALMFCLSLFLVHRASILQNDFQKLQGDIILQLNQPRSEGVNGKMAKMSKTREVYFGFNIVTTAIILNKCNLPFPTGNITVIPWTVSVQQGNTISTKENRIVVQEDGYYLVFGQVLCHCNSIMGYVVQCWSSAASGTKSTELLRCLQEMPDATPANTCYTSGIFQLHQDDELELVILHRPQALISVDADSTFFGVIQLN